MKYYETTAEEYISAIEKYNLHPELREIYANCFPKSLKQFDNLIAYGPVGSGKYSQVLTILKKYSPSELKYEKKMIVNSEKSAPYTFHISDIHYEIDMAFLGCNSKNLWHDVFSQIVDIISVKQEKIGIILCKNFHMIHSELIDIFYSYMQPFTASHMNITIKFILLTEHISFIPNNILNCCSVISIKKPEKKKYIEMIETNIRASVKDRCKTKNKSTEITKEILKNIDTNTLINIKEIQSFSLIKTPDEIPDDIFNIVCDKIIADLSKYADPSNNSIQFSQFRDSLYDIFIYNLDVIECVWYILSNIINSYKLDSNDISDIIQNTYTFLKYFNNNYRPIYHLESIMFYMINKIQNIHE